MKNPNLTYPKVRLMLYNLAWKSARRHPYPNPQEAFDEARSLAHVAFMEACKSYDPSRASFTTHCWLRVWCKLKLAEMHACKKAAQLPLVSLDLESDEITTLKERIAAPNVPLFDVEDFAMDLGRDARVVLKMILDTPRELMRQVSPGKPKSLLKHVRRRLVKRWRNEHRVNLALQELSEQVAWRLERTRI